jgi:dienelactone hydrolase
MSRLSSALAFVVLLVAGAGCQSGPATHLQLVVDHPTTLMDMPLSIQLEGAQPGAAVSLRARAVSSTGSVWTSSATFMTDSHGRVDLAVARPLPSSSYSGADPMGLFWSLKPNSRASTVPTVPPDPERVTLTASGDGASTTVAITRMTMGLGIAERQLTLAGEGLWGRYFAPPAQAGPHAAVLVFGGSEGGLSSGVALEASLLASHGYPALALAYFGEPGLPPALQNVPLDYFVKALTWLGQQPGADPQRVTVMGASRGTEAALLLGAHFPQLVHAVVAYAPSSVVNPGLPATGRGAGGSAWTLDGQPLPTVMLAEYGLASPAADPQAIIPVEDIHGPILLVSGDDDSLWPSPEYAHAIMARLNAAQDPFSHQSLVYPGAGHGVAVAVPYGPAPPAVVSSQYGELVLGGSGPANARALADSWPKLLQFLAEASG